MKMKSTSQTPRRIFTRTAIVLAITALALSAAPNSRGDADCVCLSTWTSSTGDWFNPSNWSFGVPDCGGTCPINGYPFEADINNSGTAQITTSGASACEVFLGKSATDKGNLSVNHGTLTQCNEMWVGYEGKGTLSITNGGVVTSFLGASIASRQNSSGTVTVDGTNSQWRVTANGLLYVGGSINGEGGTGLLTVTNGGTVTSSGILQVYKSGTLKGNGTVTTTNGTTVDGTVAPNGAGGTLNFGGGLQLNSAATTQCKVTPQDPSTTPQVSVSAQVSLGGRLSVSMTGDFSSAPTRFTLLYADSVAVGHITFGSTSITYPTGQGCWVPQITYDYTGGHVHVYLDRVINCN
jgi:T5SS/PEP-CTERM-associated repeat protein